MFAEVTLSVVSWNFITMGTQKKTILLVVVVLVVVVVLPFFPREGIFNETVIIKQSLPTWKQMKIQLP